MGWRGTVLPRMHPHNGGPTASLDPPSLTTLLYPHEPLPVSTTRGTHRPVMYIDRGTTCTYMEREGRGESWAVEWEQ